VELRKRWHKAVRSQATRYLTRNGVVIRRFFLHVSSKEQKKCFLERIEKGGKEDFVCEQMTN
jgi:polyphosphate kinase 2 (PPK2 family)